MPTPSARQTPAAPADCNDLSTKGESVLVTYTNYDGLNKQAKTLVILTKPG